LTVVVPTYQRCVLLEGLLRALASQTIPAEQYEVIVIVDGSTDRTSEMLSEFETRYSLTWRWQPNAGRATACNAGFALARGELVVLLDDDMEPPPTFLQAHAAAHPVGTRRAVMGAAPIVTPATPPAVVQYIARKFNRHLDALARPGRRFGLRDFYSGNLSVRRDVLLEIGGFDKDFTSYGNEDLELSCRLRMAGVEITFSAAAVAYQRYVKDFAALARDNVGKGKTAVLLATKHPTTLNELKLTALDRGPALRRLTLQGLVTLTRHWPATFDGVVRLMSAVGRLKPPGLDRVYGLATDYCYLLGAVAARDGEWTFAARGRP
jgi:glycosyltransferase involved in cell wall biosynthesis